MRIVENKLVENRDNKIDSLLVAATHLRRISVRDCFAIDARLMRFVENKLDENREDSIKDSLVATIHIQENSCQGFLAISDVDTKDSRQDFLAIDAKDRCVFVNDKFVERRNNANSALNVTVDVHLENFRLLLQ
jgi:hypothetical protein